MGVQINGEGQNMRPADDDFSLGDYASMNWNYVFLHGTSQDVHDLIASGASVDERDETGKTLLHKAAEFVRPGIAEIINALLDAGADIWAKTNDGLLPVDFAEKNEILCNDPVYLKLKEGRSP